MPVAWWTQIGANTAREVTDPHVQVGAEAKRVTAAYVKRAAGDHADLFYRRRGAVYAIHRQSTWRIGIDDGSVTLLTNANGARSGVNGYGAMLSLHDRVYHLVSNADGLWVYTVDKKTGLCSQQAQGPAVIETLRTGVTFVSALYDGSAAGRYAFVLRSAQVENGQQPDATWSGINLATGALYANAARPAGAPAFRNGFLLDGGVDQRPVQAMEIVGGAIFVAPVLTIRPPVVAGGPLQRHPFLLSNSAPATAGSAANVFALFGDDRDALYAYQRLSGSDRRLLLVDQADLSVTTHVRLAADLDPNTSMCYAR